MPFFDVFQFFNATAAWETPVSKQCLATSPDHGATSAFTVLNRFRNENFDHDNTSVNASSGTPASRSAARAAMFDGRLAEHPVVREPRRTAVRAQQTFLRR